MCVFVVLLFAKFFAVFVVIVDVLFGMLQLDVIAKRGDVKRIFVCCVGFGFSDCLWSAYDFLNGRFVRFVFMLVVFFRFVEFFFFAFLFDFIFFEDGAASGSLGSDVLTNFVLLRVNQARRKRGAFFIAQFSAGFAFLDDNLGVLECFDFFLVKIGFFRFQRFGLFAGYFRRIRAASEKPARQRPSRTTRSGCGTGKQCAARLRFLGKVRLRFVNNVLLNRRNRSGRCGPVAKFGKRFARKNEIVLCRRRRAGRALLAGTRSFLATGAEVTTRAAPIVTTAFTTRFEVAAVLAIPTLRRSVF